MLEKQQIIQLVQELGTKIGNDNLSELFQDDKAQGDKKIGHGQFRELAALCDAAECYEEIELLVKYNTAKAKPYQSWAKECRTCGNQKFGDIIVSYLQEIKEKEQNVADVLPDMMHFFGYLYWQSRVWSMENPIHNNDDKRSKTDLPRNQKPNPQQKGGYR